MIYFIYTIFHFSIFQLHMWTGIACVVFNPIWSVSTTCICVISLFRKCKSEDADAMHKTHMRKCRKDRDICWRLLLNLSRALIKHRRIVSASSQGYILLFTRFSKMHKRGMNDYSRDILPIKLLHLLIWLAFIRSGNVWLKLKMLEFGRNSL